MDRSELRYLFEKVMISALLVCAGCSVAGPPRAPSAGDEMGPAASSAAAPERPLIIEWPGPELSMLAASLGSQITLVRYDTTASTPQLEVLRQCRAMGRYGYVGTQRYRDSVMVKTRDELAANLPAFGLQEFGGAIQHGTSLAVDMTVVGLYRADQSRVLAEDLVGPDCTKATHFISSVAAGQFEVASSADASYSARGGPVGAGGTGERRLLKRGGDGAACGSSTTRDTSPPENCSALLRLELSGIPGRVGKSEDGSGRRTAAMVAGGVGVVGAAVGAVFAVMASSKNSESKNSCNPGDPNRCSDTGIGLRDDAMKYGNVATVGAIVGGVGLTMAAVLWLWPSGKGSGQVGAGQRARVGVQAGPGGLSLQGVW